MAESICRTLRDGSLEGEHAPALTIKDTAASPFGFDVFAYVLSQLSSFILAGKSQSRIQILDCYTDPLGWKGKLVESGNAMCISDEASSVTHLCKDVRDLDNLYSLILELGKGLAGQGKAHFSVAIDSEFRLFFSFQLFSAAAIFLAADANYQISCIYWLLHSDLHELRVTSSVEYMSSMVANVEPLNPSASGQRWDSENVSLLKQNFQKGKLNVRFKRRNGRVRLMCEEFHIGQSGINFTPVSSEDGTINQGLLPKVQFSLQLSEKEQTERAKVVLPFEHQGNGKPIQIYDGRRSLEDNKNEATLASTGNLQRNEASGEGEIIYFRDSDDERPDSDEDPDDDLDI
ncbi:hypothetical protein GH714_013371 [Hevea brasiliensis]|uniref:Elongator complex protein 5 n=1 Tax=Hevea brasiliensis TaxID=3981 RepID=A0A6A6MN70_HEVBR|nr:hypothetical protein GH714_013371 [Hevea brasiliensis]